MTDEDYRTSDLDLRTKELKLREEELQTRRDELQRTRRPLSLTNAAVWVTIIAGISGVLFAGMGLLTARIQRDADGLKLFVESQDKFAAKCPPSPSATSAPAASPGSHDDTPAARTASQSAADATTPAPEKAIEADRSVAAENLTMLVRFYPDLSDQFMEVVDTKYQSCLAAAVSTAYASAEKAGTQAAAVNAADQARYTAISTTSLPSAAALSTAKLPTVYIQYTTQKAQATQLQSALQSQGYNVPGIQHVSAAPNSAEIRYYHDSQTGDASALATAISKALNTPPPASHSLEKSYPDLPAGTLEYWFPSE